MGLDMYLRAKMFQWTNWDKPEADEEKSAVIKKAVGLADDLDIGRVDYVIWEFIYWRKANQIHRWFVENIQDGEDDCGRYYVDLSDLRKLLDVITRVLADKSKAEQLLPTGSGFYFGSTEYDKEYFDELEATKRRLEYLFANETKFEGIDFEYYSSW